MHFDEMLRRLRAVRQALLRGLPEAELRSLIGELDYICDELADALERQRRRNEERQP